MPQNNRKNRKNRNRRGRRANQAKAQYNPASGNLGTLDQKTFLFNEFVPVFSGAFVPNLQPIDVSLNVTANGWAYQVSSPQGLFQYQADWGLPASQFASLSLLYDTYTVRNVSVTIVPSFPSAAMIASPQLWSTSGAIYQLDFGQSLDLAAQNNVALEPPLKECRRGINFTKFIQQNEPTPYLLTYNPLTGARDVYNTGKDTRLPAIQFQQEFHPNQFNGGGISSDIPILVFKLSATLHFRGRQNSVPDLLALQALITKKATKTVLPVAESKRAIKQ